jgi:hypothetical protein
MKFLTAFLSRTPKTPKPQLAWFNEPDPDVLRPHIKIAFAQMSGQQLHDVYHELKAIASSHYKDELTHFNIIRIYARWIHAKAVTQNNRALQNAAAALFEWGKTSGHLSAETRRAVAFATRKNMSHHVENGFVTKPLSHLILFMRSFEEPK